MYDTKCQGDYVEVRPGQGRLVGKSKDGSTSCIDPGVQWPEARRLLEGKLLRFGEGMEQTSNRSIPGIPVGTGGH